MLHYAIQTDEMNNLLRTLHRVLKLRITFFDLQNHEIDEFDIKEMAPFCRHCRRHASFDKLCVECDQQNLAIAKQKRAVCVYHCHAGLIEGIVPLYDRHGKYLGAIVFGQIRDQNHDYCDQPKSRQDLLFRHRSGSVAEMLDIGNLLKSLSEYIIDNEIIKYQAQPWVERLENYIQAHLHERLTLARLASEIGRSTSFLSHNFSQEFGLPIKQYIQQKRITRAKQLLTDGHSVKETAAHLGYYDAFHFSKEFKRLTGFPPSKLT